MRVVFTLGLAFATGGSFGESTEGTSTRFGVGAVGILGIAGGRMCGKSRTRIFPRTEVITLACAREPKGIPASVQEKMKEAFDNA